MSDLCYRAYGLVWQMPLACPELLPCTCNSPDVVVYYGCVPETSSASAPCGPLRQLGPDRTLFSLPQIAHYLVRDGREIIIQREPGVSDEEVRLFLLGVSVTLLLHQRRVLPLHASAICTPHGALIFAGHSGSGKSTLLGAFLQRGYPMLADDVAGIALDEVGVPRVLPGYAQFKLWADSAAQLAQPTDSLRRVRPQLEKFAVPVTERLVAEPVPLHIVYILSPYNKPDIYLEPLQDAKKFNVLLDYTWQKLALKRIGRHTDHFQTAAAVANCVRIVQVNRPEGAFLLKELVDLLEEDFG